MTSPALKPPLAAAATKDRRMLVYASSAATPAAVTSEGVEDADTLFAVAGGSWFGPLTWPWSGAAALQRRS